MTKFEQRTQRTTERVMANPKIVIGWYAAFGVFTLVAVGVMNHLMM